MNEALRAIRIVEEGIEDIKFMTLQSETLKRCGAISKIDYNIIVKLNNINQEILDIESNGENCFVAKGMLELFVKEFNFAKGV